MGSCSGRSQICFSCERQYFGSRPGARGKRIAPLAIDPRSTLMMMTMMMMMMMMMMMVMMVMMMMMMMMMMVMVMVMRMVSV